MLSAFCRRRNESANARICGTAPPPAASWRASSSAFNVDRTMPAITVIIPVFNRAHIVERAIASALAQEVPPDNWSIEVVVIDDGSSDDLGATLRRLGK